MAVYFAVLEPGDTILSLSLSHGGHLTHGLKVNFSGRLYDIQHYGVSRETNVVDYDDVLAPREGASAEADRLRRVGVSADGGDAPVPRDRGRGGRVPPLRHGALRRARRGRHPAEPGPELRLRHLDDAQDARRAALGLHPLQGGARAGDRPGGVPRHAGRPAEPRHRREGHLLQDRGLRAVPAVPAADPGERGRALGDASAGRAGGAHRRHGHPPPARRPPAVRMEREGCRGAARGGRHHRQPQHDPVRRASADGRVRRAARDARP